MKRAIVHRCVFAGVLCLTILALRAGSLNAEPLNAEPPGGGVVQGPVTAGNGVPDGLGATLGRFFVLLTKAGAVDVDDGAPVPLELFFTSSTVTVDPITCAEPSTDPCDSPGKGIAGVSGYPTSVHTTVMAIKLASAQYLPWAEGYSPGSSLEVALEGSLYAGPESAPGDPSDLRLFLGNPAYLLNWGADESSAPANRTYQNNTGAGVLIGDIGFFLFPGWLRGHVVENDGSALFAELQTAEISPVRIGDETRVWIEPDFVGARKAGLPDGVFGQIEVNYSAFATPSRILPGAASNDAELHVTAMTQSVKFLRGDCDGDGTVAGTITDALVFLRYSFAGGPEPPCLAACDADGDGQVLGRVVDAIYLLRYQFQGGPAPPAPFPECGPGESASAAECAEPGCR